MLIEAYGEHALHKTQCKEWFKKFKNGDFDVTNVNREKPPETLEDTELHAVLGERVISELYKQHSIDLDREIRINRPEYRN